MEYQTRELLSHEIPLFIDGLPMDSSSSGFTIFNQPKTSIEAPMTFEHPVKKSPAAEHLVHEVIELNDGNRPDLSDNEWTKYSGFAEAGIGTYFTPHMAVGFRQVLPEFSSSLDGRYNLSKDFTERTDRSNGKVSIRSGTILSTDVSLLKKVSLDTVIDYQSKSFHFYGSQNPALERTLSEAAEEASIEDKSRKIFPYTAVISIASLSISDSSMVRKELCLDFHTHTTTAIPTVPILTHLRFFSASEGLGFMDFLGGVKNYSSAGLLLSGSLYLDWAKGMGEQKCVSIYPHLLASYQMTSQQRIYAAFEPLYIPQTLSSALSINQFLSASSLIRHTNVTNAGELGLESDWTPEKSGRHSFSVKSAQDLLLFSDLTRPGVWSAVYSGQAIIVLFNAEMFAKLTSNDYFASGTLFRSAKDVSLGRQFPYTPTVEVECKGNHDFGPGVRMRAYLKYSGERKTDLAGTGAIPPSIVVDVDREYLLLKNLKACLGIKIYFM